jgi:hypothetical protein
MGAIPRVGCAVQELQIPPFVRDTHDLNLSTLKPVENRVRGDKRRSQSWPQLLSKRSRQRISPNRFTNPLDLPQDVVCDLGRGDACVIPPMSTQSSFARGAHATLLTRAMLDVGVRHHLFDIERLALSGIEFADPGFDLCAQSADSVAAFEQLAAEQLLRGLRKFASLRYCDFERLHHNGIIPANHRMDEFCVWRGGPPRRASGDRPEAITEAATFNLGFGIGSASWPYTLQSIASSSRLRHSPIAAQRPDYSLPV